MPTTLRNLSNRDLVSKRTPARVKEAQWRLENWNIKRERNKRMLTEYVQAGAAAKAHAKASAKKSKRCPVKKACADHASTLAEPGTAEWWTAYKAGTAWMRALRDA